MSLPYIHPFTVLLKNFRNTGFKFYCDEVYTLCHVQFVQKCAYMTYIQKETGKDKFHRRPGHEGPDGEWGYTRSSTFSLTSAVDSGQRHAPAALPPGKSRYPLYRRLGGHRAGRDRYRKCRPPSGFDPAPSSP